MKNRRNIAIAASISGILAAPLAFAPPAARADELADLRANQALLQERLDQLSQIPGAGHLYQGPGVARTAGKEIIGGSFARSFLIPGTDTSIRIGGAIRFHMTYFMTGGNVHTIPGSTTNFGNNGAINSAPLHVHTVGPPTFAKAGNRTRSLGDQLTFFSPQQSKVNFETRTPTAWGEARTFMEFDWAGSSGTPGGQSGSLRSTNSLLPRLRFAYATLGGLLGGQANSNFADPDAGPDSINFGGMVGSRGVTRIPQIRYTWPVAPYGLPGAVSVAAEAPETEGWTPGAGLVQSDSGPAATATTDPNPFKAPVPDLTFAWYIQQPWGHMDFGAVVRPELQMKDGLFLDRTFTGYGIGFSGDYKPGWFGWKKDYITWQFTYGDGVGRYIGGNTTMLALVTNYPAAPLLGRAATRAVRSRTVTGWGGNTSYRHWWTPTLRSNVAFGIQHQDINNLGGVHGFVCFGPARFTGGGGCGLNKELVTSEVNLIWNPVPFADLGIEYFWGHRLVLSNLKGDVNGVISTFRVNF